MANSALGQYLNDHVAASVAALDLMDHLHSFTNEPELVGALTEIRRQVQDERGELEALMTRLGVERQRLGRMVAWTAVKLSRIKLRRTSETNRTLHLFQGLETLMLAVDGKRCLWLALGEAQATIPGLQGIDYPRLIAQSTAQRETLEHFRLRAAQTAFQTA